MQPGQEDPYQQPQPPAYGAPPPPPAYQPPPAYGSPPPAPAYGSETPAPEQYPTYGSPPPGSYPPPPAYQPPGYEQPVLFPGQQGAYDPMRTPYPIVQVTPRSTQSLVAMILGIASIPIGCCGLGLPIGIAAVIVGILELNKVKTGQPANRGQALTGVICGAIGVLIGLSSFATSLFHGFHFSLGH
jgi:hypothetical protein